MLEKIPLYQINSLKGLISRIPICQPLCVNDAHNLVIMHCHVSHSYCNYIIRSNTLLIQLKRFKIHCITAVDGLYCYLYFSLILYYVGGYYVLVYSVN
jgi:hypothetical protein